MTLPRPRYPGERGMVTRRTTGRQYLLRPDRQVTQCLGYLMGYVQERYGFHIRCGTFLSNHKHVLVEDREGNLDHSEISNIERDFNSLSGRALNVHWGREENLWAGGGRSFNFVEVPTLEDQLDEYEYVLGNVVEAELVDEYRKWPGLLLDPGPSGYREYTFERPEFFFTKDMPARTVVRVSAPEFVGTPRREFMRRVYEGLNRLEESVRERVDAAGRSFLGAKGVLRQSHTARPKSEEPRRRGRRPRYSTRHGELRKQLEARDAKFLDAYRWSLGRLRLESEKPPFPHGTFMLVEHFGLPCEPG